MNKYTIEKIKNEIERLKQVGYEEIEADLQR
jgi:hypothetical protein